MGHALAWSKLGRPVRILALWGCLGMQGGCCAFWHREGGGGWGFDRWAVTPQCRKGLRTLVRSREPRALKMPLR